MADGCGSREYSRRSNGGRSLSDGVDERRDANAVAEGEHNAETDDESQHARWQEPRDM